MIHARENCTPAANAELDLLIKNNPADKVEKILQIFRDCKADEWATSLKEQYYRLALQHLDDVAVLHPGKDALRALAAGLMEREN